MVVTGIYIYPIKSLNGIKVPIAEVQERGFKYDRRWMLVDSEGMFITQRKHPVLHKLSVSLEGEMLTVSCPDQSDLSIAISDKYGDINEVKIWDSIVNAQVVSEQANQWFSKAIGMSCKLVHMPLSSIRLVNPLRARHKESVSFADGYPYLIVGQASLDDLNSRMESPIPMHRFRPNIVFSRGLPYNEDNWDEFQIGDIKFYRAEPCERCVFTTIDQETGEKGKEPLTTLSKYRRKGNNTIFGLNALASIYDTIRVGDTLEVLRVC